jgi:hypothetical protein
MSVSRYISIHVYVSRDGDAIKVFMRVRPPAQHLSEVGNSKCLEVDTDNNLIRMQFKPEAKLFTFDQVADENTSQVSSTYRIVRTS